MDQLHDVTSVKYYNGPIIHDITSVKYYKENEMFSHWLTCFSRLNKIR